MLLNVILNSYPFEVKGLSSYRLLGFVVGCIWVLSTALGSLGLVDASTHLPTCVFYPCQTIAVHS